MKQFVRHWEDIHLKEGRIPDGPPKKKKEPRRAEEGKRGGHPGNAQKVSGDGTRPLRGPGTRFSGGRPEAGQGTKHRQLLRKGGPEAGQGQSSEARWGRRREGRSGQSSEAREAGAVAAQRQSTRAPWTTVRPVRSQAREFGAGGPPRRPVARQRRQALRPQPRTRGRNWSWHRENLRRRNQNSWRLRRDPRDTDRDRTGQCSEHSTPRQRETTSRKPPRWAGTGAGSASGDHDAENTGDVRLGTTASGSRDRPPRRHASGDGFAVLDARCENL
ncbi:unnamed protein product [Pleuronectes platessa]|uniref:Uncharacterized protein n=1 Tax=Pleuronectes platessa TaxID=8262 RepID=A0A9N7YKS8_PLEPL|nr:unnamed protein product [Pleuronectes platessa]